MQFSLVTIYVSVKNSLVPVTLSHIEIENGDIFLLKSRYYDIGIHSTASFTKSTQNMHNC